MKHYSKAIMGIKILLDDMVLTTEEEIAKFVKDIGVTMINYLVTMSIEIINLLHEEG